MALMLAAVGFGAPAEAGIAVANPTAASIKAMIRPWRRR
jgi:hypothetical protein